MEQVSLRARTGRVPGTRASRRLRREGQVPAVVYGHGMDPINVSVDARELYAALHTDAGLNALINLDVDGPEVVGVAGYGRAFASVVARDGVYGTQFHPEKSGPDGLRLLRNFATRCRSGAPAAA